MSPLSLLCVMAGVSLYGGNKILHEARSISAIHHSMVKGKREGDHESWREFLSIPYRFHGGSSHTQDGDLGMVDERCKVAGTERPKVGYGECAAAHIVGDEFPLSGFLP